MTVTLANERSRPAPVVRSPPAKSIVSATSCAVRVVVP